MVTICTTSLTFNNSTFCPHSVFMFCVDLRTNSDYFPTQHWLALTFAPIHEQQFPLTHHCRRRQCNFTLIAHITKFWSNVAFTDAKRIYMNRTQGSSYVIPATGNPSTRKAGYDVTLLRSDVKSRSFATACGVSHAVKRIRCYFWRWDDFLYAILMTLWHDTRPSLSYC